MSRVKTVCNMCSMRCGIEVQVDDGKVKQIYGMQESQLSRLCIKAKAIPELVYSSERLTTPLKRANGNWQEISWDVALDFIADKLAYIKQMYGARSVVTHLGNPMVGSCTGRVIRRFCDLYGTPNYTTGNSLCYWAKIIADELTFGVHVIPHYSGDTRCMIVWGQNPSESYPITADAVYAMKGRGAKLIVIDPRVTQLAKEADIHAQIRPGTDCALALGMLNIIITEGLYDKPFVEQWTVGFDQLVEYVKGFSPEEVERITWVPAKTIEDIARMYATNKSASISRGISPDHCTNGIQNIRAITTLMAVTGNIDVPGGNIFALRLTQANLRLEERVANEMTIGADYPLFSKHVKEPTVVPAIDGILTEKPYPIKALLIDACNPALTWPNTNKVKKAFEKLELTVVIDIFMTDTARMADIVLPAASFLECEDIRDYCHRGFYLAVLANKAIEPIGQSMEDWKIWAELGRRMGYAEYFPWKDTDELLDYLLKPANISVNQLRQNAGGIYYREQDFRRYLKDGFNTPSKKVEIYSQLMSELGYDPLPTFNEPAEGPVSRPDLLDRYPLILITGAKTRVYRHSSYHNLPSLRKLEPEPLIEINPQTAGSLGIEDGDLVKVESSRGSTKLRARLTEDIHPKVVSIQHGWREASANLLTDDIQRDPVSGYPGFRSIMCRVSKDRD